MLVADGVGGLDLCGTALRYVLARERLPYAIEVFPGATASAAGTPI